MLEAGGIDRRSKGAVLWSLTGAKFRLFSLKSFSKEVWESRVWNELSASASQWLCSTSKLQAGMLAAGLQELFSSAVQENSASGGKKVMCWVVFCLLVCSPASLSLFLGLLDSFLEKLHQSGKQTYRSGKPAWAQQMLCWRSRRVAHQVLTELVVTLWQTSVLAVNQSAGPWKSSKKKLFATKQTVDTHHSNNRNEHTQIPCAAGSLQQKKGTYQNISKSTSKILAARFSLSIKHSYCLCQWKQTLPATARYLLSGCAQGGPEGSPDTQRHPETPRSPSKALLSDVQQKDKGQGVQGGAGGSMWT